MLIYDQTSLAFSQKAEKILKEIIQSCGITVAKSRFLFERYWFPITVVVFEGKELGHFNAPYLQIGLNKKLIYLAKDSVLRDILKHELAHYFTHILFREVQPHGPEFKAICQRFGFPSEIADATMNVEESNLAKEGDIKSEQIVEKVKKLLMLAQSSNAHEAELATIKANQLLLRHNIDSIKDRSEPIYMERLLQRQRKDAKITAIYGILKHFIVRTVIGQGKNSCCLEVSGHLTNVKLASYVANFLDKELDHMWEDAKKEFNLKGLKAKNSFYLGVMNGFDKKMKLAKMNFSHVDQRALVLVEQKLDIDTKVIYRRLSSSRSEHQTDYAASSVGHSKGLTLTIRNALDTGAKNLYLPN
jgi:hypothetical protein